MSWFGRLFGAGDKTPRSGTNQHSDAIQHKQHIGMSITVTCPRCGNQYRASTTTIGSPVTFACSQCGREQMLLFKDSGEVRFLSPL